MDAQGATTNAKEDTRFYSSGTITADLSHYDTNLTATTGGGYETNSARTALATRCEYYVRCPLTLADTGCALLLVQSAGLTDATYGLTISGGFFTITSSTLAQIWTGPAVAAGDFSFAFSTRPNPDTTGASDAQISEVVIYNHTSGKYAAREQFTHATPTASSAYTLAVGGAWTGAALVSTPASPPTKVRISSGYHPHVEFAEDWVAARTAYAGTLADTITEPLGPRPVSSGLGDSGEFVGRAQVGYATALAKAVQRRCWSPLVNEVYRDADTIHGTTPATYYLMTAPGSSAYKMIVQHLRWVEVPSGATHAWARVHVRTFVTAGAAVPTGVRVYAMNRPPTVQQVGQTPAPALDYAWRGEVLTNDHGAAGTGEWLELGLLRLPTWKTQPSGWRGTTHLCLAYAIDPAAASANDANARLEINAWHVRPVYVAGPGGFA